MGRKRKQPTPPLGRPIDRLQPPDRDRIRADVAAFLAYVRRRKAGLLAVGCLLLAISYPLPAISQQLPIAIVYLPIVAGPGTSHAPAQPTPTPTVVRPPS